MKTQKLFGKISELISFCKDRPAQFLPNKLLGKEIFGDDNSF